MPTHLGGDYEPTPFRSMEDHLAKADRLATANLRGKGSSFVASTDRKTSLLRDRPARRAVKRAYRIWVSDAAHHCVQLRIDLLFTMSDNLHRVIEDRRGTNSMHGRVCWLRALILRVSSFTERQCSIDRNPTPNLEPKIGLVEPDGIEPTTSCLQSRRSPN
jgi:hypothetical protein